MKSVTNMLVGGKVNRLGSSLICNSMADFSSKTIWNLFEGGKVGSSGSRPRGFDPLMYISTEAGRQIYFPHHSSTKTCSDMNSLSHASRFDSRPSIQ